jgi:hypothetical protein
MRVTTDLVVSNLGKSCTFNKSLRISELTLKIIDAVKELASFTILADSISVELSAELGHEVAWEMGFLL